MDAAAYLEHDGLGLAGLLERGEASPVELMRCAIGLARQRAPALNLLCHEADEAALAQASAATPRGTFGALPFLLKDSGLPARALPSGIGSRLFGDLEFKFDATLLQRFEQCGFIPFARTTVPELCMAPTTEALRNGGPTRNPWDPSRSAGGSSGGAAAAVAVGIVPIAHANDGGGSIRIPASCCGVYGLKPSRGLVPMGPARGEGWGGLAAEGVVSRSVRDTAAVLDAVAGYESGAPYAAPAQPASYLRLLDEPFARPLRILKWTTGFDGIPVDPECRMAVDNAARLLASAGHEVIDAAPPDIGFAAFIDAHTDVMAANIVVTVDALAAGADDAARRAGLENAIYDGYGIGRTLEAARYARAINTFHAVGRRLARHMEGHDLVLTPTLAQPPAKLGEISTATDFRSFRRAVSRYATFLSIINASGQPAASVPLHWNSAGLPIGVQLIGAFGDDATVLRVSAQLESLKPWKDRRPPLRS